MRYTQPVVFVLNLLLYAAHTVFELNIYDNFFYRFFIFSFFSSDNKDTEYLLSLTWMRSQAARWYEIAHLRTTERKKKLAAITWNIAKIIIESANKNMMYFAFKCSTKGTLNTWHWHAHYYFPSPSRAAFNVTIFFLLSSQSTWWLYVVLLQINTRYKWAAAFIIHIAASLDHDNHLDSIFYTYDDNISRLSVCISKPNDLNWSMLGPIQIETRSEFIFKFNWTFQWKRRTLKSAWIKYWT